MKNSPSEIYKEIDWFGRWYEIMKERGDNDEPTFGRYDLATKQVDWFRFSHSKMDGVGVLNFLYKQKNIELKKFPDLKEKAQPNFIQYIYYFVLLAFKKKSVRPEWKEQNWNAKHENVHRLSFEIFSVEETKRTFAAAKNKQVSPCAFLMKIVSDSLLPELSFNAEGSWTLPVNLRPVLKRQDFNSNHSSGILVPYTKNSTEKNLQESIKQCLKNKEHWCIWKVHQIGKLIGMKGMRYLSRKSSAKTFMIGSFSYLGPWDLPANDIWVGGPPGSKNFPISIMVMMANDQMSLSLKIHPFILKDQNLTDYYLKKIVAKLRETLAQS